MTSSLAIMSVILASLEPSSCVMVCSDQLLDSGCSITLEYGNDTCKQVSFLGIAWEYVEFRLTPTLFRRKMIPPYVLHVSPKSTAFTPWNPDATKSGLLRVFIPNVLSL